MKINITFRFFFFYKKIYKKKNYKDIQKCSPKNTHQANNKLHIFVQINRFN